MRLGSNRYYMLVASLPPLPARVEVERLPISPERLQVRLRMLEPEDAEELRRLREVLQWGRQFEEPDDNAVVARWGALVGAVTNPLAREVVSRVLDVRMVAVALRSRRLGVPLPKVGLGTWSEHLRRHFEHPEFRLAHVFPWIAEADRLLRAGELLELYRRFVLGVPWAFLKKRSEDYSFSFEAVLLYIARWELLRGWLELEADRGREVLETLLTEALGEHANLYS